MNKTASYLKKILKVILWVIASFVFLFIIIAVLIQIPAIQTNIVHYTTSFVSKKTHTRVDINKINISFPKSVVIEGLFLEDLKKDTLIYCGEAKINISFKDLFNNEIHINSFSLEDAKVNMSRIASDSLFNYNFLLTAFSDTSAQKQVEPVKGAVWTFNLDDVSLKNCRLRYNDNYGGMNATADLANLSLKTDKIDLARLIFNIDELLVEGLNANVLIKPGKTPATNSEGVLPLITANKIEINSTNINFGDSIGKLSVTAAINQFKLKKGSIDLQKQIIASDYLSLSKSEIKYNTIDSESSSYPKDAMNNANTEKNEWKVSVKEIETDNNSLAYNIINKPEIKYAFDVSHLDFKHVTLAATDFNYSSTKTEVSINKFSAIDRNNFTITKFETDFVMDQHSITTKNLKAETSNSVIDADLYVKFSSLQSLIDSMQLAILNLDLKNVSINNSDILYFNHNLNKQSFFRNTKNITTVSGILSGSLNNLSGKNMVIRTGTNTVLKSDFIIVGLPAFETAHFNIPNLTLNTGKKDITAIVDTLIPKNIELPLNVSTQIIFKGNLRSFISTIYANSSFGSAHIFATIDKNEKFKSKVTVTNFDLGRLLQDKVMFGPVSLIAETEGTGLGFKTIKAKIKTEVSQLYFNKYTYHNLNLEGTITGKEFEGKIKLVDENATFDYQGLVNLNPNQEQYKFHLVVQGADLQKLNFTKDDVRIGLTADADFKGKSLNEINGKAGITNIVIAQEGKQYNLDSLILKAVNKPGQIELNIQSAIIDMKYSGTFSPEVLPDELSKFINHYFPISDIVHSKKKSGMQDFNFEVQLHNHPILSKVFFPKLNEFEPGLIQGSFDSKNNDLKLNAEIKKLVYGSVEIKDFTLTVNSDANALNYKILSSRISNSQIKLDNFLIYGKLADNKVNAIVSSINERHNKKLFINSLITKDKSNYKIMLDPEDFCMMNSNWEIAKDNYIEFGKQGFIIHHLNLHKTESQINISSVNEKFNDDLSVVIKNLKLDDFSGIIEKDTSLVKGVVDGNVLLKKINNAYGIIANATISNLFVHGIPIGNLKVKADNPTAGKFNIDVNLSGAENNLTAHGYFVPGGGDNSVNIKAAIQSLSLKTLEAFSMGTITKASGNLTGNFLVEGNISAPDLTGELVFNNAFITPAFLNNTLHLKHETVLFKKDGIYFNTFTLLDPGQHKAIINGTVKMQHFDNIVFAVKVITKDFLLFNTTEKDNKEFYGRMIIDSRIDLTGPMDLPVINARLKMKKGSNFTFAVSDEKLTTYKGEDVVEFDYLLRLNPILYRQDKKVKQKSGLTGFEISSVIEIDKQVTLRLLIDPSSSDSLVVKGEAALSFTIDRSGKMSLTGAYYLNEGSYLVSLETVIKRKFDIQPGSTIIWNGDPMDADISINATYSVHASPIDLIADQMSGLGDADKNIVKQRYLFLVFLKLRGAILQPEVSFDIQLRPEDKGILGGAVNAKLNMLSEDPSALNKQVFGLLVLSRFIRDNPLQTETGGVSSTVRSTVGTFLSAQLNKWSSKYLSGVELNFDIQSYDQLQTGQTEGRTQVDIGVKKQLFNERLSVQVGGSVDVEGEKAKQNSASDITGDVVVEYKLTEDGRFRIKGFRHNQYEGAIEGQLIETGAGVLYVRDFNKWKNLFKTRKNRRDSANIKSNDTLTYK